MGHFRNRIAFSVLLLGMVTCWSAASFAESQELRNDHMIAKFGPSGLVSIQALDFETRPIALQQERFSITIGGKTFASSDGKPSVEKAKQNEVTYTYRKAGTTLQVIYRIEDEWRFVSKQLRIAETPSAEYRIESVTPVDIEVGSEVESTYIPGSYLPQLAHEPRSPSATKDFGAFARLAGDSGLMLLVQNPFLSVKHQQNGISLQYAPEMTWKREWGAFTSDTACIGPYQLSGTRLPSKMVPEWKLSEVPANDGADRNEIEAFRDCVRSFLIHPSSSPISIEVGWTLNDYQIDVATEQGRKEYKRVIDSASSLGIQTLLYAPANSDISNRKDDADDWSWEHVLWFGFGQKLRKGSWDPRTGAIPASVTEMLDYAKSKKLGLVAYVYPSLPFQQNQHWLVNLPDKSKGKSSATLASREFQDFFLKQLLDFKKRTGLAGYSFDYAFFNLPGSSAYAQWYGWRRVLEELRKAAPDIVIDGRQTYQTYGPWTWLAGSYPHPTGNDEQAESFRPFPDLHFDRVSGDRTRFVNYWYRNYQFAPEEVIPGYMTHQTERSVNLGEGSGERERSETLYTTYRQRDWDFLGFKYSVLSSIASGGWNSTVSMIPGRDVSEDKAFQESADQQWLRGWLQWTIENKEYLRHTQNILGAPAIGKVDASAAIVNGRGFLFLFNPNYKQMPASLSLDASLGLRPGTKFILRELYPNRGRVVGKSDSGVWSFGDKLELALDGTSATVLAVEAVPGSSEAWAFGAVPAKGDAVEVHADGGVVQLSHVSGERGTEAQVGAFVPEGSAGRELTVNGKPVQSIRNGSFLTARVRFAGKKFSHSQQIELVKKTDGSFTSNFLVPQRVFSQLERTRKAWPIDWTKEDEKTTWLVPGRLLVFVQFAEPDNRAEVTALLDEQPLALTKAYSSVREHGPAFVGFYADLSQLRPDVEHTFSLRVPLEYQNKLQGVFFDNVEPEFTEELQQ